MGTKRDLIAKIPVNEPNFKWIIGAGKINGSLLIDIEDAMETYATQQTTKLQADKDRMAELLKECKKSISDNCAQSDELIEIQDKITETLSECGYNI